VIISGTFLDMTPVSQTKLLDYLLVAKCLIPALITVATPAFVGVGLFMLISFTFR
jgi:hypothetical protein